MSEETIERVKTQSAGIKWLYEMELLQNPQLINNLKLNIFMIHKRIKHIEILVHQEHKAILVFLELTWWGKTFNQEEIKFGVEELLTNLLPNFRNRVVFNYDIFKMSMQKAEQLIRGTHERSSSPNDDDANGDAKSSSSKNELPEASNLLPDQKEQTVYEEYKSDGSEQPDLQSSEDIQDPK
jgi:hypothetical protein